MNGFTTFLFDLDGTLIDHFAAIHRTHAYTRRQLGLPPPTLEEVRAAVGGGFEHALRHFVKDEDLPRAKAIYREYWDKTMLDDVTLLPGAKALLEELRRRGAKAAVLTNKLGTSARKVCDHLGISACLGAVVGDEDTPWRKPEPRLVAHTLGLLGSAPDGTGAVMIGDSPFDIITAHQAHLPAWCVTTGTHTAAALRKAGVDAVFPGLPALQAALG